MVKTEDTKSKLLRQMVIKNPNSDASTIVELCKSMGEPLSSTDMQNVYQAQHQVRKRYGAGPIVFFNGKLNLTDLCRRALKIKPNMTDSQGASYLEMDGIEVSPTLVSQARKKLLAEGLLTKPETHPDPKVGTGTRARVTRKRPPQKTATVTTDSDTAVSSSDDQYKAMERQLDALIQEATSLGNRRLAEAVRHTRRLVSSELV